LLNDELSEFSAYWREDDLLVLNAMQAEEIRVDYIKQP